MIRARGNPDRRADNASAVTTGAQRQATKAGIGFAAMHNAFAAVDDSAGLQAIWTVWDRAEIQALLDKWLALLPNPFSEADRESRLPIATLNPAGRVLADPTTRHTDQWPGVFSTGHPQQPRCRSAGPSQPDLRPQGCCAAAGTSHRAVSARPSHLVTRWLGALWGGLQALAVPQDVRP